MDENEPASQACPGANRRRAALALFWAAVVAGFGYFVLPQLADLEETLRRLSHGDPWWLGLGAVFQILSVAGYVAVFHTVFSCDACRLGWRASYRITMASDIAGKFFAAAGAGSIALTVWALRACGLDGSTVSRRMVCLEVLLYAVYLGALVVAGLGVSLGVLAGRAPEALTLVPALLALLAMALALATLRFGEPMERGLESLARRSGPRTARWLKRAAQVPRALGGGLRAAIDLVKARKAGVLGAVAYWAFDIATLWTGFHAFGHAPPGGVIVLAYFVGTTANVLPIPGGVGGVEGGMIGTFLAFGVSGSLAVLAVLAYRTISYWLPTGPGALAYVELRNTVGRWRGARPTGSQVPATETAQ